MKYEIHARRNGAHKKIAAVSDPRDAILMAAALAQDAVTDDQAFVCVDAVPARV